MATEFLLVGTVPEQSLTLYGVGWDQYVAVGDALPERANLRMIYTEGRLTLRTRSLLQCRIAERLGLLITIVAASSGLECEPAGSATFRRDDADAGA
ncbi:MAG TPA: hypothetical protein VGH33_05315, partial [Isosphaeraceae bacterium]